MNFSITSLRPNLKFMVAGCIAYALLLSAPVAESTGMTPATPASTTIPFTIPATSPGMNNAAAVCRTGWSQWENLKKNLMDNGRIIDPGSARKHTSSEAQAYGLFFALIANDKKNFEQILRWTENNLAGGDLTSRLPAWLWGRRDDGTWGIIDTNPASDADLWLAYTLAQASRLWGEPRYTALSSLIAARILREETASLPTLGLTLLPAPVGFHPTPTTWRLNPSYMPMQVMHWFANYHPDPAWKNLLASSLRIILESAANGIAPDWIIYNQLSGFTLDSSGIEKGQGGYNAIRVYLWAGLLSGEAPDKATLIRHFLPMGHYVDVNGTPPELIDITSLASNNAGPVGFSAALIPFLESSGQRAALATQLQRIEARPIEPDSYYGQALSLFALGWRDRLYRFSAKGNLMPYWADNCH